MTSMRKRSKECSWGSTVTTNHYYYYHHHTTPTALSVPSRLHLRPSLIMSEGEKRKKPHAAAGDEDGHDVVSGTTQKKVRDDGPVTDDEVEEFFTILSRINAAAQYFKSGSDRKNGWRASLEEEIVRQVNSVKEKETNQTIDLNLSPNPE